MGLVDFLALLEHQNEEMEKQAAEEEAAGRIAARGFLDELNKLAATTQFKPEPVLPSAAKLPGKGTGTRVPPSLPKVKTAPAFPVPEKGPMKPPRR